MTSTPVRGSGGQKGFFKHGKACFGSPFLQNQASYHCVMSHFGLAAALLSCEYYWIPPQLPLVVSMPLVENHCFQIIFHFTTLFLFYILVAIFTIWPGQENVHGHCGLLWHFMDIMNHCPITYSFVAFRRPGHWNCRGKKSGYSNFIALKVVWGCKTYIYLPWSKPHWT